MTTPDFADWQTPQAHATAIAGTGVPLLAVPGGVITKLLQTVAAAGSAQWTSSAFTQTGWALNILVAFPNTATVPFCSVVMTWTDAVSGTVYDESTYLVCGASGATAFTTIANGLAKSSQLQVTVNNLDPAQAATVSLLVSQDSITRPNDVWHWRNAVDAGLPVPTWTLPTLPPDESCLGVLAAVNVPASTTNVYLFGMAPGRLVTIAGHYSGPPAGSITIQCTAPGINEYTGSAWLNDFIPAAVNYQATFTAPRAPIQVKVQNTATTAATFYMGMFAAD